MKTPTTMTSDEISNERERLGQAYGWNHIDEFRKKKWLSADEVEKVIDEIDVNCQYGCKWKNELKKELGLSGEKK